MLDIFSLEFRLQSAFYVRQELRNECYETIETLFLFRVLHKHLKGQTKSRSNCVFRTRLLQGSKRRHRLENAQGRMHR